MQIKYGIHTVSHKLHEMGKKVCAGTTLSYNNKEAFSVISKRDYFERRQGESGKLNY